MRFGAVWAAGLLLAGCATAGSDRGVQAGAAAVARAPRPAGTMDPEIMKLAQRARGVSTIHVDTGADGEVTKISVTHQDADAIPAAVRDLARTELPGSRVVAYETELYADTGERFEVEVVTPEGRACEVSADRAGKLAYKGCTVAAWELDGAVRTAAMGAVADGRITWAYHKQGPSVDTVFVDVTGADGDHQLEFEGGRLTSHVKSVPSLLRVPVTGAATP